MSIYSCLFFFRKIQLNLKCILFQAWNISVHYDWRGTAYKLRPHARKYLSRALGHQVPPGLCQWSPELHANQISMYKKTHRPPPALPPLKIRLSSLLKMKLHKMRDRNTLTAVIYLPNDQVLNYARGTQWNSPDTSLHCWVGGLGKSWFFFHARHTWSPSTAAQHSDSSNHPSKRGDNLFLCSKSSQCLFPPQPNISECIVTRCPALSALSDLLFIFSLWSLV